MIIGIIEQYHDYQPNQYYIDTNKLNLDNPIDKVVSIAVEKHKNRAFYDASNWGEEPYWMKVHSEPNISDGSKVEKQPVEEMINLTIQFE